LTAILARWATRLTVLMSTDMEFSSGNAARAIAARQDGRNRDKPTAGRPLAAGEAISGARHPIRQSIRRFLEAGPWFRSLPFPPRTFRPSGPAGGRYQNGRG